MNNQWNYLLNRLQQNNLPHALLLSGDKASDKSAFAIKFSKTVLCEHHTACNECRNCQLIQANSHPDFYHLQPEEAGKAIRIDQIRELIAQFNQTAQQNSYKIAIIEPADALNPAAANALLKTLEEPNANTLIFLISDNPSLLSATIRSRCQIIKFFTPQQTFVPNEQQQKLLNDLKSNLDPIQIASHWLKQNINEIVEDLILITMEKIRSNTDKNLFNFLDKLYEAKKNILRSNLNQQLLLEDLFCSWQQNVS